MRFANGASRSRTSHDPRRIGVCHSACGWFGRSCGCGVRVTIKTVGLPPRRVDMIVGTPQLAQATLEHAKRVWHSHENTQRHWREVVNELNEGRAWEPLGLPSLDAVVRTVTGNSVLQDASRLVAATYHGERGVRAYDAFACLNDRYFAGELPWPLITWALTAHGSCLGLTRADEAPVITLHPSLLRGREKPNPWSIRGGLGGGIPSMYCCMNACTSPCAIGSGVRRGQPRTTVPGGLRR
jgi:hypothetical protein